MNKIDNLSFKDAIPQLAALYRQGLLVPFLGAGMSRDVCCGWTQLLKNLAFKIGVALPEMSDKSELSSTDIIRLADDVISALRPYNIESQIKIYQEALLNDPNSNAIPDQTMTLAQLYWPLTITTNYDDVFLKAAQQMEKKREHGKTMESVDILGRSVEDCQALLHSLDKISSPKLWTIQGFVGGQINSKDSKVIEPKKRLELARQIVLGHLQYQKVINDSQHFRKAFAEVFRRRSLFFLGSGILEDYLINLFGEILLHQGCGPYPHFALIERSKQNNYDNLFMQRRLGVVPIFYDNYKDIPAFLKDFSKVIKYWIDDSPRQNKPLPAPVIIQDEVSFKLTANSSKGIIPLKVTICKSTLPVPDDRLKECTAVSVGRRDNALIGSMGLSHVQAYHEKFPKASAQEWLSADAPPSYVFKYGDSSIFGIAARRRDLQTMRHDTRDLGIIPEAVCAFLKIADKGGFATVHIGPVASGRHRTWHPIHPFAQSLIGIRDFLQNNLVQNIKRINMYVIDPATWYAIISRKIGIEALLTSNISTHTVETIDVNGTTEVFNITLKQSPTISQLLKKCNIDRSKWHVSVYPLPMDKNESVADELIISSTMRLILTAIETGTKLNE